MPTALITGITGQDDSYLAEFLLSKGYKIVGMSCRKSNFERITHFQDGNYPYPEICNYSQADNRGQEGIR